MIKKEKLDSHLGWPEALVETGGAPPTGGAARELPFG